MGFLKRLFVRFEYKLIYSEGDNGKGFVALRCEDQQKLIWQSLPRSEGLESIDVVGESYRMEVLQQPCFSFGSKILLLPEPDNPYDPNAVAVWDINHRFQAGYIPRGAAARIAHKLAKKQIDRCIVMWETTDKGKRNSIRLLLIGPEARIQTP